MTGEQRDREPASFEDERFGDEVFARDPNAPGAGGDAADRRAAPGPPAGIVPLWFAYLYLRPRRFFEHFGPRPLGVLTFCCSWLLGMAIAYDRIETRSMTSPAMANLQTSWLLYGAGIVFGGAISGLFAYAIGGWFYRVRIRWSGAREVDSKAARRVYIYAAQVHAIPTLLFVASLPVWYATPKEAMEQTPWWVFIPNVGFIVWSYWVSFTGVRTVFDVGPVRSLIWFLVLPIVFTVSVLGAVFAVFMALGSVGAALAASVGPDVSNPSVHRASSIRFQYPGNWALDRQQEGFDPEYYMSVYPPQDAEVTLMRYPSGFDGLDLDAELGASLASYTAGTQFAARPVGDFVRWGEFAGLGRRYALAHPDGAYTLVMFVAPVGDGSVLEFHRIHRTEDEGLLEPGFRMIRDTLELRPLSGAP